MRNQGGGDGLGRSGRADRQDSGRVVEHDTLVIRLSEMLRKLNQGETLEPQQLVQEFNVSLRTIQRDVNVRLSYLPMEKYESGYRLMPAFLGKLSMKDIARFASLAGVRGLFPSLTDDFLRDIFDARIQTALLVKGHHYEDISGKKPLFRALEAAIVDRRSVRFDYLSRDVGKTYTGVEPYKLINHKGIWYLAGRHDGKLKTFAFGKLSRLESSDATFLHDPTTETELNDDDGIWFGEKTEVVIKVAAPVASYFKRRKLIVNQVIEKDLEDGGLILSTKVTTPQQVLPIIRYWLPHLRIISPESLQAQMEDELRAYLSERRPGRAP